MKSAFLLCVILIIGLFTACGSSDKEAPVISKSETFGESIVVTATDNVQVIGYALTYTNQKPSKNDAVWQSKNRFDNIEEVMNYYIWAKDEAGNISGTEIAYESTLTRLAREYDHLAWYLDESQTKVINGVTYVLNDLKKQYGDLYRFVEPLTEEEVNYRFQYIVELISILNDEGISEDFTGGIQNPRTDIFNDYVNQREALYKELDTSTDQVLARFSSYYEFSDRFNGYSSRVPSSIEKTGISDYSQLIDVIDQVSFEDKDWFIRDYMFDFDRIIKLIKKNNEEPTFVLPNKN